MAWGAGAEEMNGSSSLAGSTKLDDPEELGVSSISRFCDSRVEMMVGCWSIGAYFVNIEHVLRLLRRVRSMEYSVGRSESMALAERLRLEPESGTQRNLFSFWTLRGRRPRNCSSSSQAVSMSSLREADGEAWEYGTVRLVPAELSECVDDRAVDSVKDVGVTGESGIEFDKSGSVIRRWVTWTHWVLIGDRINSRPGEFSLACLCSALSMRMLSLDETESVGLATLDSTELSLVRLRDASAVLSSLGLCLRFTGGLAVALTTNVKSLFIELVLNNEALWQTIYRSEFVLR